MSDLLNLNQDIQNVNIEDSIKESYRDQRGIGNHTIGGDADITGK